MRLAFFRYLPPRPASACWSADGSGLQERLAEVKTHLRDPGTTDSYQRALMEHARAATEADIAWLNDLIHTERQRVTRSPPPWASSVVLRPRCAGRSAQHE